MQDAICGGRQRATARTSARTRVASAANGVRRRQRMCVVVGPRGAVRSILGGYRARSADRRSAPSTEQHLAAPARTRYRQHSAPRREWAS
jgi:hypothetical protein